MATTPGWGSVPEPGERSSPEQDSGLAKIVRTHPHLAMVGRNTPHVPNPKYGRVKRFVDLAVTVPAVILLSPLFIAAAAAIYLTDGRPIFFTQLRTGKDGKRFKIYKFRTMVRDAEERKQELWAMSEVSWPDFKIKRDPRITSVGRVLRPTYLDELPQLLNVVKGDMSLVGPRPTFFEPGVYETWQTARLDVKPGITGLWQIDRDKEERSFDGRARMDIRYARRRSLRQDLWLMARTLPSVLRRKGA